LRPDRPASRTDCGRVCTNRYNFSQIGTVRAINTNIIVLTRQRRTYTTSGLLSGLAMVSFMMQRRTDEQTALTAEYALYLVDIRGVEFALKYLDTCNVSRSILTRALQSPDSRRHHERRQQPRND
jgi:hypothetical protein